MLFYSISYCIRIYCDYSDFCKFHFTRYCSDASNVWLYSGHFITSSPQNVPVKRFRKSVKYLAKIWTKVCGLLFWSTLYMYWWFTTGRFWQGRRSASLWTSIIAHVRSTVHQRSDQCRSPRTMALSCGWKSWNTDLLHAARADKQVSLYC